MAAVRKIDVTFSRGSFQEWCEANGDTYSQDEIDRWETNYNQVITERLEAAFPGASIDVGEGNDQLAKTDISIEFEVEDVEDEWDVDDRLKMEVSHLIDIASSSELMDRVFS